MLRFLRRLLAVAGVATLIAWLAGLPGRVEPRAELAAAPPLASRASSPTLAQTARRARAGETRASGRFAVTPPDAIERHAAAPEAPVAASGPVAVDEPADARGPAGRDGAWTSRITVSITCELDELHEERDGNAGVLQRCIELARPGGVLEIEPGIYPLHRQVVVDKPLTIRTARSAAGGVRCTTTPEGCARLVAGPELSDELGMLVVASTHDVTLEHLVLDGNRRARDGSLAARDCRQGQTASGYTATVIGCTRCTVRDVLAHGALCGTAMYWAGAHATIEHSRFEENGDSAARMWADGLTAVYAPDAHIRQNQFYENSDVGLIVGYGVRARIEDNHIRQRTQTAFAGLMLDNFNSDNLRVRGDFRDAEITDNIVDCRPYRCVFGIQVGPRPWYPTRNIVGGKIWNNEVYGAKVGINVDGGGVPHAPVQIFSNRVTDVAEGAYFAGCDAPLPALWMNVAPLSVVDRGDEATPAGARLSSPCQLWSSLERPGE